MSELSELIFRRHDPSWHEAAQTALQHLFGGGNRYRSAALGGSVQIRAPQMSPDGVPFAALINAAAPTTGPYGGTSFVIFPNAEGPACFGLVVGTQGLAPDEHILTQPGHIRRTQAIARWLNSEYGGSELLVWTKDDPVRRDAGLPRQVAEWLGDAHRGAAQRYGDVMYAIVRPSHHGEVVDIAANAYLDLLMLGHGEMPLTAARRDAEAIVEGYMRHLMPNVELSDLADALAERRYLILEGPPGTGKTRMAQELLRDTYNGRGRSIQFHPNTTYESFIGGLAPTTAEGSVGLAFSPKRGHLLDTIDEASRTPDEPCLLHIDEINRADLSKVLGEAIYLFEAAEAGNREIAVDHIFDGFPDGVVSIPPNLHILGTMNSSDRSIAVLDLAIRRRFGFIQLWPQAEVVEQYGCALMQEAFQNLLAIFVDHASEEAFGLMPGHSYFLASEDEAAKRVLRTELGPLLREYIANGYVAGFTGEVLAYLQWLEASAS